MVRRALFVTVIAACFTTLPEARQAASVAKLLTTAEASKFTSTSTYEDVVRFMRAVDAASPNIHYTTYGTTFEGRAMPMAVVGAGLKDASPESVRATGRLRVHIQGNIHAGEVEGKESAQILLREFALGQHADWLKTMVFIVTPIYNADGNERMSPTNRGSQHGPINGMGTRAQAQNINLNRDYMKLDTVEANASMRLFNEYDPHVSYDLHTSNGSQHAYHLTYSPPLHPNTHDGIMTIMKTEWFPFATQQVREKHGWHMFYYGNASGGGRGGRGGRGRGGDAGGRGAGRAGGEPPQTPPAPAGPRAWSTFEHVPRFHNNYVGLRNRFALLSEAYSYATFEDRIKATNYFLEETLTWANQNVDKIKKTVAAADAENLVGKTLATRAAIATGGMVEILMGATTQETNPVSGRSMNRRADVVNPEQMIDRMWFEGTATEEVPAEYYVPVYATAALNNLRAHGVQLRRVTEPVKGVERFTITSNTQRPVPNNIDMGSHGLRTLEGTWEPSDAQVPVNWYAVSMTQPLARLAFILLAPTSDDGLVNWNFFDPWLGPDAKTYPVLRRR